MKTFKLNGRNANWLNGLRMSALNLRTLTEEVSTPIPDDNRMYVSVANGVVHVDDERREILTHDVSEEDKGAILSAIKGDTPDFLLTLEGKVVGYANLCTPNGNRIADGDTDAVDLDIDDIMDNVSFALRIVPVTATEPARKKEKTFIVTQRITITLTDEVTAEDEESARKKARDLQENADDFIYEWYTYEGARISDYESDCKEV
jgi:hypothetical protein